MAALPNTLFTVPPVITTNPHPLTELVTTIANMICCATGAPCPEIQWNKDMSLVNESLSQSDVTGQFSLCSSLVLNNLTISDIADYTCIATNTLAETISETSAVAALTVLCELDLHTFTESEFRIH